MKRMRTKDCVLSVKEERFCQLIAAGKCANQSDAYRKAYKSSPKANTIHIEASKLRAQPKIAARIQELMQPVLDEVRVSRQQWLRKMESYFYADVRKMFDVHGNPIDIPQLGDHEAAMIEGFEVVEDFTKVRMSDGHTEAVPTGYTKKYKLTPKLKALLEFGKVMGWCDGESAPASNLPPVLYQINFIEAGATPVPSPLVVSPVPQVSFVQGKSHGNGNRR